MEFSLGLSFAALMCGFVVVYFVWEKFLFNSYAYLGVMPVDENDPLI